MGTQEGERNWVDVANDLLSKCHLNLRLKKLTECNADVFISLYENILGEKVPDYIVTPCSQEDDTHNVQSVIDSLSLDYLQISLSHITGENVVGGDTESIKNLLEIFDGLLEYLNEEINEESQNSDEFIETQNQDESVEIKEATDVNATEMKEADLPSSSSSPSVESVVQSKKNSLHSSHPEEVGSASELTGMGVSARTFKDKQEELVVLPQASDAVNLSGPVDDKEAPQTEQMHSAIPLQPPTQCNTPRSPGPQGSNQLPTTTGLSQGLTEENTTPVPTQKSDLVPETLTNGILSPATCRSPAVSEKSVTSQRRTEPEVDSQTLEEEMTTTTPSPPDTEEEEEDLSYRRKFKNRGTGHRNRTEQLSRTTLESFEEPLSYRRKRNKQTEEELQHMSEKLAHRLEELDQMLKRVLGENGEDDEIRDDDDDEQSHHDDITITESQRTPRIHTVSETPDPESTQRTRSSSPSPPGDHHSLHRQLEDPTAETLSLDDGRQTNLRMSGHSKQKDSHHRKYYKHPQNKNYEEVLGKYEDRERKELQKARLKAQKAEREYREAILGDVCQESRLSPPKTKTHHKSQRNTQTGGQKRLETSRRASSMKIRENELLPMLREELPHLHLSSHALGRMWEQQIQQMDRLRAPSSSHSRHRSKLSSQLEEAQKKHDLLVELNRKDQDHKRRLREFKDRIQQQKSVQTKLREQRQQIVRAKKYHNDYHVQHRARLMKARTKEEKMFRQLFEEGLELQKLRLREQRASAREQQLEHQRKHQDQIDSLENYYKDQFSLLAEKLAQEREEIQVRKKSQEKALLKMKRELRSRMEREINELQKIIIQNDEDDYLQDLEVQRLRNRVHMASFQYNTSYLH